MTDVEDWSGQLTAEAEAQRVADEHAAARGRPKLRGEARRLLLSLARPHRRGLLAVFAIVLIQVGATLAGPYLVGVAIDRALPDAVHDRYGSLLTVTLALVAAAFVSAGMRLLFVARSGRIGQAMLFDLRRRAFDHAQALSVSFHERFTSGRVISRLTSDIDTLNELLDEGLDGLLTAMITIAGISVLLFFLDVPLALVVLASLVPLILVYRWYTGRAAEAFKRTRETIAALIVHIVETFNGIRAVQAFRRETRNDAIFGTLNDGYRAATARTYRLQALLMPGSVMVGGASSALVLFIGGYRVASGGLALGVLAAFLLYLRQFYDPMEDIAVFYNSLQSATAALEKIATVLAEPPAVPEPASPAGLVTPLRGALDLDEVEFGYRADRTVLHRLDLHIPPGQTVALVGATGAGKSTIAKLITRFYDPSAGAVRLDGRDLREIADADLHGAIVMITQEGFLFSGSVADNIAFGSTEASRADVIAVAQAVGAHEFITRLPDGYDTDVRKRGGRLSAGQRQLVSFARALLADPAVLVLDEATSSLDVPTERAVQRALRTVLAERTALIIAHRLSTVEIADRVLVLDAGAVVEDGTPDELLAESGGRFAALHESWRTSLV